MDEVFEGWYTDPYAIHDARWMSQGTPTPLIRDGSVEGHDPPPDGPFKVTPILLGDDGSSSDVSRADDVERASVETDPVDEAWDVAGEI